MNGLNEVSVCLVPKRCEATAVRAPARCMQVSAARRAELGMTPSAATSPRASGRRGGERRGVQQVSDMAKEGADMTEETECMINRNAGKDAESAESSGDAKEMRAVILTGFGGLNKLRLGKKAMPELRDGEVKIRVKAW